MGSDRLNQADGCRSCVKQSAIDCLDYRSTSSPARLTNQISGAALPFVEEHWGRAIEHQERVGSSDLCLPDVVELPHCPGSLESGLGLPDTFGAVDEDGSELGQKDVKLGVHNPACVGDDHGPNGWRP